MGIDPDAYMAGVIPSLNRGGSWRQDEIHSGNQSSTSYDHAASGSIFPRPSQIAPHPPFMGGNRSNAHFSQTPWVARPPFAAARPDPLSLRPPASSASGAPQSSVGGGGSAASGKAPVVGPTKHPGWANLHAGGYRSSPTSPTAASGASFIAGQAKSQYGVKFPPTLRNTPLTSPPLAEPMWEWASGSPKPMTAEPDYFNLPPSPGMVSAPQTPTAARHQDSLPPPPKPAPHSPRPRIDSNKASRPALNRRHTHDRYSPEMLTAIERANQAGKIDSKSLGRTRAKSGLRKRNLEIASEAGESYYAPSNKTYAHSVEPSSTIPPSQTGNPGVSGSVPPASRPPNAAAPCLRSGQTVSRTNGDRPFRNRSHPALSTISSTAATSYTAPNTPRADSSTIQSAKLPKSGSRPALSTIASSSTTVGFTQTAPTTPTTKVPGASKSSMDMRSLQKALPTADPSRPVTPLIAPSSSGYVPPTSDDGYDRYIAHPAAPVPPRADLSPEVVAKATKAPTGAGLKHVTADTYRPPGMPKPLKEIGWNRDGPAMRTYGIAWLREGTADALPGGPAGPRWIQARPPPPTAPSGGSWWDSGG